MFGRAPIGVIFACPKCPLLYVGMQERRRDTIAGRFDRTSCGAMIHAWSGAYDYPIWRVFATGRVAQCFMSNSDK